MLVSPWQLISILVLVACSVGNSNLHKLTEVAVPPMHLLDDGERPIRDPPPPVDWVDGFVHGQDRMNGMMITEAGAIQDDGCSAGQTKQLSDIDGRPRDGRNIASRNTPPEQEDGHQNGEACRNIGAMSDVQLIPLSDLDAVVEADTIGPEPNPAMCENSQMPIPVCAPDQLTNAENFASELPRCRPCRFIFYFPPKNFAAKSSTSMILIIIAFARVHRYTLLRLRAESSVVLHADMA